MGASTYDILIIGGGVMGSSIAYHLCHDGLDGSVAVLEKDPAVLYFMDMHLPYLEDPAYLKFFQS